LEETESDDWLQGIICSHASSVLGVDYLEEEVNIYRERGYNVLCADDQDLNFKEKFDVIVAGDLIEHLSNVSNFL
jgi:2-polyprenyl-3-methyl-5-hydroxy-6-metoxy-1,4-benzoquinol methylase